MQLTTFNVLLFLTASLSNEASAIKRVNKPVPVPGWDVAPVGRVRREATAPVGVITQPHRRWQAPAFRTSNTLEEEVFGELRKRMGDKPPQQRQRPQRGPGSVSSTISEFTPPTSPNSGSILSVGSGMSSIQEEEQPEVEEAGPSSQNKAKTEPELIWKKAVKKGKELMNELLIALKEEKDRKVVKSIFDLKRDHWDIKSPRKESKEFNNLKKIFTDFPDKPDGKELTIISAVRSPTVRLREQTAVYEFAVDKNGYFFIAVNSHKAKNEPTHWSEVAFSVWHHRFPDPSALKYVVRHNIMNTDTQAIIQKAYKDIKLGITEDPHVWEKGTNAFYALLGTVNGKGVVRMLTDYSNSLGRKTIGSIFTAQSRDGQFHMILDVIRASSEVKFHPDNPSGAASAAANPGSSSQNPTIAGPSTASPKTQKSSVPGTMKASSRARMDPAPRLRRSEGQILHRFKPQILRRSRARVLQSR